MNPDDESPTFAELLDWLEGRLESAEAEAMAGRVVAGGEATRRTVSWLRQFLRFSEVKPLPSPPPIVRQRLRHSFDRRYRNGPDVSLVSTELVLDSRVDADLVGVRGGVSDLDEAFQLAFTGEGVDVLLDVSPAGPGSVHLEGQVLSSDTVAPAWEAMVEYPGGRVRAVDGDELGCFWLREVPADVEYLSLSNGFVEVVIHLPFGEAV
jgi:hypothetical protein